MLVPFKKEHLEVMDMRQHEREVLALSDSIGAILELSNTARTGVIDGRVIACGGVTINMFGNAEIWLIPSIYLKEYAVTYFRFAIDWLADIQKSYNIKRMQTACIDDELHNSYMQHLGFTKEGVMQNYALGKDYAMWSKLCQIDSAGGVS